MSKSGRISGKSVNKALKTAKKKKSEGRAIAVAKKDSTGKQAVNETEEIRFRSRIEATVSQQRTSI